jgi:hypothetical protein
MNDSTSSVRHRFADLDTIMMDDEQEHDEFKPLSPVATSYFVHNMIEPSTCYCFFLDDIDNVDSSQKSIKLRS